MVHVSRKAKKVTIQQCIEMDKIESPQQLRQSSLLQLHDAHARELNLGGSCKWASTMHLPFCFLDYKYARKVNETVKRE